MNAAGGRVMLITGGSGSIGRAIAAEAARAGWTIALHGRRADPAEAAASRLRGEGAAVSVHLADFGNPAALQALIAAVAGEHGRIDAVVDCAVSGPPGVTGRFAATDPAAYAALAEQSPVAFQRLAHAALPWLAGAGGSLIAFVSDAGVFAAPGQAMIGAMRAATIGFVRNLAVEVAADGVRVHAVSPGFVDDTAVARRLEAASAERMARARRKAGLGLPTPADIAPLVLFLCGDGARRITGQVISVNGGMNA